NPADARIIQDGDDELFKLDFDGQERLSLLMVLLLFDGATSLVSLSSLEGSDESVGERWLVVRMEERASTGRKPVESHVEAELKSSALERLMNDILIMVVNVVLMMRFETSPPQETSSRGEQSGSHMKRSDLSMASPLG
ncbi:hypothetical protein PanWU01x14_012550, partial [Parasponia andersonii]